MGGAGAGMEREDPLSRTFNYLLFFFFVKETTPFKHCASPRVPSSGDAVDR